ncbi:hypothetical protein EDB89DRAFT_1908812 [Lactarius sanguifluus]|nr:hypothetical protein EDB89DRAFT_1908812 [Lactarius sanguifluus]
MSSAPIFSLNESHARFESSDLDSTKRAVISAFTTRLVGFVSPLQGVGSPTPTVGTEGWNFKDIDISDSLTTDIVFASTIRHYTAQHLHALATLYANFDDELSVPLVAGCEIYIWRARFGRGRGQRRTFLLESSLPLLQGLFRVGGSGGDAVTTTHPCRSISRPPLISPNRQRQTQVSIGRRAIPPLGFGKHIKIPDTDPPHTNGTSLFARIIPRATHLPSAAFSAFRRYSPQPFSWAFESLTIYYPCLHLLLWGHQESWRCCVCAPMLARVGLLMQHRTVVTSEGSGRDDIS